MCQYLQTIVVGNIFIQHSNICLFHIVAFLHIQVCMVIGCVLTSLAFVLMLVALVFLVTNDKVQPRRFSFAAAITSIFAGMTVAKVSK